MQYKLNPGEKAVVIGRVGNNIGNGYMHRVLASIAIIKADGKKVYRDHTPYWIRNTLTFASHYRTGMSKANQAYYAKQKAELEQIATDINKKGYVD